MEVKRISRVSFYMKLKSFVFHDDQEKFKFQFTWNSSFIWHEIQEKLKSFNFYETQDKFKVFILQETRENRVSFHMKLKINSRFSFSMKLEELVCILQEKISSFYMKLKRNSFPSCNRKSFHFTWNSRETRYTTLKLKRNSFHIYSKLKKPLPK